MTFREFMSENGYTVQTTFWEDFTIADLFGLSAIRDTYNRAFKEWNEDYKFLTELVLVLNHKDLGSITRAVPKLQHFTMTYGSRQTYTRLKI